MATPWFDERGPLATYTAVIAALQKAGVYQDVPMSRIFLMSPSDLAVQELEKETKRRSEGFIHILSTVS